MIDTSLETVRNLISHSVFQSVKKEELESLLSSGKQLRVKLGIDPTKPDLHLGHAVVLQKLRAFQDAGHTAVLIFGTFTAQIGDPSGKTQQRVRMTREEVESNIHEYLSQAKTILSEKNLEVYYNHEWLEGMSFIEILELAGQFTVMQMLERDMFQERMKKNLPINMVEFLYPLMQGYDSVIVRSDIEIGGTDQLFNCLAGRPIQKHFDQKEQCVIVMDLLVGLDGKEKMSKSLGNIIALLDSPEEKFGKVMSISDDMILHYARLCALFSEAECEAVTNRLSSGENPRDVKRDIAQRVVALYHGNEAAKRSYDTFLSVFSHSHVPDSIPVFLTTQTSFVIIDLLLFCALVSTKSEARRAIESGSVRVNGEKITSFEVSIDTLGEVIVQIGKRKWAKIMNA